jgi:hypothetical protein
MMPNRKKATADLRGIRGSEKLSHGLTQINTDKIGVLVQEFIDVFLVVVSSFISENDKADPCSFV